jgi:YegS/Rv2252/BmrU family lipid kinase
MKKLLFIINPRSGRGVIRNKLLEILDLFVAEGYEPTVHVTQASRDAVQMVAEHGNDYDLIVASGGDGTLSEVVTGMMISHVTCPLGYIPAGTTNDFASSVGIPKRSMYAAETAVCGEDFPCDIGLFNDGHYFIYVTAFGLFTDVSFETSQDLKNMIGHAAYIIEGVKRLAAIPSYHMKITWDDGEIEDDYIFGMVTNSKSIGGFKNITGKHVCLDDGVFEVTLVRNPSSMIEKNEIITALTENNFSNQWILNFKASYVRIESEEEVSYTIDGEDGKSHRVVELSNCHRAVTFRVHGRKNDRRLQLE